jgi:hypothetical protein
MKSNSPEFEMFDSSMRKILTVSHKELQRRVAHPRGGFKT